MPGVPPSNGCTILHDQVMTRRARNKAEDDNVDVEAATLARFCRLNVRTIFKLAEQGIVVRLKRGRYAQWASIGNLIEHYREQATGRIGHDESADAVRANCERKDSRKRLNELRIAKIKGELLSLPEAKAAWTEIAAGVRALFLSFPARARFDCPNLTAADQKTLEKIARDMLTEIAFQGVVRLPGR